MPAKTPASHSCSPVLWHVRGAQLKFIAPRPKTCAGRLACFVSTLASYRSFPGQVNYFQPPPKAHRNGADKLIECELNGCLGTSRPGVASSGKPK